MGAWTELLGIGFQPGCTSNREVSPWLARTGKGWILSRKAFFKYKHPIVPHSKRRNVVDTSTINKPTDIQQRYLVLAHGGVRVRALRYNGVASN